MRCSALLSPSKIQIPPVWADINVSAIAADSRAVRPGTLFVAIPGAIPGTSQDGRGFIGQAVAAGAVAVLAPAGTVWPDGVPARPLLEAPEPRRALAHAAAALAGRQPRQIAAVTGTNGKTSSVEFLRQIWTHAGHRAASLGTLGLSAPGFPPGAGLTTPDPVSLANTLAALAAAGIEHAAMEASSHGLDQFRLDGVSLAAGAFTNLTRDHLDYHGTEATYRAAKLRLFSDLLAAGAPVVANADMDADTLGQLRRIATDRQLDLHTVGESGTAIRLLRAIPRPDGQILEIEAHGTRHEIALLLPGRFQADNVLIAAGLALALGETTAIGHLEKLVGVRGRMELAARLPNNAAVYVDYAHTPDALERLLLALRPHTQGRLHLVFGAGGDRDRGKRPLMGAIAARLADATIVTDDNPRSEYPAAIRAAILAACPNAVEIGHREAAIAAALAGLRPGDVLAVAGKGHEQGQTVGATVHPFDDAGVIRRLAGVSLVGPLSAGSP